MNFDTLKTKKITLTTLKWFIRNAKQLWVLPESSFDGMIDGVRQVTDAKLIEVSKEDAMGIRGAYVVDGSGRNSFSFRETDTHIGIRVYNACGSATLYTLKESGTSPAKKEAPQEPATPAAQVEAPATTPQPAMEPLVDLTSITAQRDELLKALEEIVNNPTQLILDHSNNRFRSEYHEAVPDGKVHPAIEQSANRYVSFTLLVSKVKHMQEVERQSVGGGK